MGFLSSGKAARNQYKDEVVKDEARKASFGKLFRFYLKVGMETRLTFVDGVLEHDEELDQMALAYTAVHEHNIWKNGTSTDYVCIQGYEGQSCPICETGNRPWFSALFTVIDQGKGGKGIQTKSGQIIPYSKKLLVARGRPAIDILCNIAAKRGGLSGVTLDVTRPGEKSGYHYDFMEKTDDFNALRQQFIHVDEKTGETKTLFTPAKYEQELTVLTEDQLRALGYGHAKLGSQYAPSASSQSAEVPNEDFSDAF